MLVVLVGVLASIFLSGSAAGSTVVYRTVVSLTFDDGRISQWTARDLLKNHGMNATFYLNSGTVGTTSGFLSWAQVSSLAADGNEIGGHTIDHVDLPTLSPADATHQVCDDLSALRARGYDVTSFAYPFGASDNSAGAGSIEAIVAGCPGGFYTSARITQGILGSAPWCTTANCPTAETIPPWDPYDVRATGSVTSATTLTQLESFVTSAEQNGGGWVPFVFHDIGTADTYSISETDFAAFLGWLAARESKGTIVRTVGEVMSGTVTPPPGPNLLQNPSFENVTGGMPNCWEKSHWGTNNGDWTAPGGIQHTGSVAVLGEITSSGTGDRQFIVNRSSECAAPAEPGRSYRLTGWYEGALSPFLTVYWSTDSGGWAVNPIVSPQFPVSTGSWHEAAWTTPVAPAGTNGVSVGFAMPGSTVGAITIDDLSLGDAAGTPPEVQITSPGAGAFVSGQTAALAATAGAGTDNVQFFVDDQPVGTDSSSPFTLSWDSTSVADGSHTLTVLATGSDRAESSDSSAFLVDNTPPTGSLTAPTGGSDLRSTVALSSDSADTGGSGVASVSFQRSPAGQGAWTTIGTDTSSPYGASWDTTSVSDRSYDLRAVTTDQAGNTFVSATVTVAVDNTPPDISLSSEPSDPSKSKDASFSFTSSDSTAVFLCSLDGAGYTSCSSPEKYSGLSDGVHRFLVEAVDPAGNQSAAATRSWSIDSVDPTGSLTAPTGGSYLRGTVTLTSDSADTGGSGVASVSFQRSPAGQGTWTTIGTDTSSFYAIGWSTVSVSDGTYELRAVTTDRAGNSFTSNLVSVMVDNTPPTGSLTAPAAGAFLRGAVSLQSDSADEGSGVASVSFQTAPSPNGVWDTTTTLNDAPWRARLSFGIIMSGTYYLRVVTTDRAGNTFTSPVLRVRLDNTAPTSSIACNGRRCQALFSKRVRVVIKARDAGSGVSVIRYSTNGRTPTTTGRRYKGPLTVTGSTIIRWRVWDRAGNASRVETHTIRIAGSALHR